MREWLNHLATRRLFDLVEPTRSSSAESKQGPEGACGLGSCSTRRGALVGLVSHLLSDAGEKMSEHPEGNASGKVEQLEAIRAFFFPTFPMFGSVRKEL